MANNDTAPRNSPSIRLKGERIVALRGKKGWPANQLAAAADISERTCRRAEASEKVSFETARAIASALEVDLEELIADDSEALEPIVDAWFRDGDRSVPDHPGLPQHPEYVYRLSGDWQGWNGFLGVDPGAPEYAHHERIDAIEDRAFRLVSIVLGHQMRRLRRRVESGDIDEDIGLEIISCARSQDHLDS